LTQLGLKHQVQVIHFGAKFHPGAEHADWLLFGLDGADQGTFSHCSKDIMAIPLMIHDDTIETTIFWV
jgi:hypothetical protein